LDAFKLGYGPLLRFIVILFVGVLLLALAVPFRVLELSDNVGWWMVWIFPPSCTSRPNFAPVWREQKLFSLVE